MNTQIQQSHFIKTAADREAPMIAMDWGDRRTSLHEQEGTNKKAAGEKPEEREREKSQQWMLEMWKQSWINF